MAPVLCGAGGWRSARSASDQRLSQLGLRVGGGWFGGGAVDRLLCFPSRSPFWQHGILAEVRAWPWSLVQWGIGCSGHPTVYVMQHYWFVLPLSQCGDGTGWSLSHRVQLKSWLPLLGALCVNVSPWEFGRWCCSPASLPLGERSLGSMVKWLVLSHVLSRSSVACGGTDIHDEA